MSGKVWYTSQQISEEESQNMVRSSIPQVINDHLHLPEQNVSTTPVAVGSLFWYNWLADERNKSFSFKSPVGTFTARHERQRNNWYWYAYHKHQGKTRKAYLGKPEELTAERLYTIAGTLTRPKPQTTIPRKQPVPLLNTNNNATAQSNQERSALDYLEKIYWLHSLILQTKNEYPGALAILSQLLSMISDNTHQQTSEQKDILAMLLTQLQEIDTLSSTSSTSSMPAATPPPPITRIEKQMNSFTRREHAVLELLLQGATNRTIASQLVISEGTVKKHVSNICGKLNAKNRSQAIAIIFSWQDEANT